jgi:hypothetical protein
MCNRIPLTRMNLQMMHNPMKFSVPLLMILTGWFLQPVLSQQFTWEMEIEPVPSTGYHEIYLPAFSTCKLKADYSDLRLFEQGKDVEVPYLLRKEGAETQFNPLPLPLEQQEEASSKTSIITFQPDCPYAYNRMLIEVQFEGKFYRKAEVRAKGSKGGTRDSRLLKSFVLNETRTEIFLPLKVYGDEVFLKIYNEDNLPLQVKLVEATAPQKIMSAELEAGKDYVIRFGNPHVSAPLYDLRHYANELKVAGDLSTQGEAFKIFADEIPAEVTEVEEPPAEEPWYQRQVVIWAVLILVVGLLGFMTIKMLKKV